MMFSLPIIYRIGGAALAVLALWLGLQWYGHSRQAAGRAEVQAQWDLSKSQAATESAKRYAAHQQLIAEAQNARTEKQTTIDRDSRAADRTIASLRQQLAAARNRPAANRESPKAAPAPTDSELSTEMDKNDRACAADIAVRDEVIVNLAESGAEIAQACDGHAADVQMLEDAWPR